LSVLRELCIWRDATARAEDIPMRALLRDEVMIGLVRTALREEKDVEGVRGMPRPVAKRFGTQIIEAAQRGHAVPADQRPIIFSHEEGPAERFEIDSLWARFQCACFERRIDPAVATSRQGVADFYHLQQSGRDISSHLLGQDWRGEIMRKLVADQIPPDAAA
jgi:ribonuclease D